MSQIKIQDISAMEPSADADPYETELTPEELEAFGLSGLPNDPPPVEFAKAGATIPFAFTTVTVSVAGALHIANPVEDSYLLGEMIQLGPPPKLGKFRLDRKKAVLDFVPTPLTKIQIGIDLKRHYVYWRVANVGFYHWKIGWHWSGRNILLRI